MTRRVWIVPVLLFALALAPAAWPQNDKAAPAREYWYKVSMAGQSFGYAHIVEEEVRYRGRDGYKATTSMVFRMKAKNTVTETTTLVMVGYEDRNHNPLYSQSDEYEGRQKLKSRREIFVSDREILFKETANGQTTEKRIAYEKGVLWGPSGGVLKERGLLKVGTDASFKVISPTLKQINTQTVKITGKEKITVRGREVDTFCVESSDPDHSGVFSKDYLDMNGDLIRGQFAGVFTMELTDEADAKREEDVFTIANTVKVNYGIPFVEQITGMRVSIEIEGQDNPEKLIPDNEYQTVKMNGGRYDIRIKDRPLDVKTAPMLPVAGKDIAQYLQATPYIQSADPALSAKAREILSGERNSPEAVRKISQWVYENIRQEQQTKAIPARDVWETKRGDCKGLSTLFAAMARAVGVPTRMVSGLVFAGEDFGYHQWNEVYLGKWIPVDTTRNRIGIPAAYIKLNEDQENREDAFSSNLTFLKMMNRTSISIRSFTGSDGKRINMTATNKFVVREGDFIVDRRAGLRLKMAETDQWISLIMPGSKDFGIFKSKLSFYFYYFDYKKPIEPAMAEQMMERFEKGPVLEKDPTREQKIGTHDAFAKRLLTKDGKGNEVLRDYILTQGNGKTILIITSAAKDDFPGLQGDINSILASMEF